MKKILIFSILISILIAGCTKVDDDKVIKYNRNSKILNNNWKRISSYCDETFVTNDVWCTDSGIDTTNMFKHIYYDLNLCIWLETYDTVHLYCHDIYSHKLYFAFKYGFMNFNLNEINPVIRGVLPIRESANDSFKYDSCAVIDNDIIMYSQFGDFKMKIVGFNTDTLKVIYQYDKHDVKLILTLE